MQNNEKNLEDLVEVQSIFSFLFLFFNGPDEAA